MLKNTDKAKSFKNKYNKIKNIMNNYKKIQK